MGYRYAQLTKLVETGEYEAVLRQMEIRPTRFDKTQGGWEKYGDQPVCSVNLYFEILDGSPGATNPDDWLWYDECWPDPDSTLDRIVKMVEGLGIPHIKTLPPCITTLPLGHCFRVRVVNDVQVGGGDELQYCLVTEVLGLAEPALAR